MKYGILLFVAFQMNTAVWAQPPSYTRGLAPVNSTLILRKSWMPSFLKSDLALIFRPRSPMWMPVSNIATVKGDNYWMGTMTSQSYNQGKLGTYYYWDVQGNLRESRTFIDIAGKNKRGLKLVFRRR